jgi:WD40 repeat protein
MTETGFYITGGTMPHNAPSYVERQADHDLYDALTRGEFCYVLTARQIGKSSLMVRTAARLRREGASTAILDLTVIGQNLTPEQWYSSLLASLGEQLDREKELWEYWQQHRHLSTLQRWIGALKAVGRTSVDSGTWAAGGADKDPGPELPTAHCPLSTDRQVIFIDEIDAVLNLPFPSDEFFAGIRACYNLRSREPGLHRITFCLLGVATPSDLIQDPRTTPFNIGRRIELSDFTSFEAAPLAEGLAGSAGPLSAVNRERAKARKGGALEEEDRTPGRVLWLPGVLSSSSIFRISRFRPFAFPGKERVPAPDEGIGEHARGKMLQRIMYWTGGHPYLTQRLCQAVASDPGALTPDKVDRHCSALFLSAPARERDDNLLFVRERLLRSETDAAGLLDLYQRVWSGRLVLLEETNQLACTLLLSGVAQVAPAFRLPRSPFGPAGKPFPSLRVRNRIYERVFDRAWVTQHMPDAELWRQRRAYRAGLLRAASAAGMVLLVVGGLAVAALEQAHRAGLSAREAKINAWAARVSLGKAQAETGRANREAERANQQAERVTQAEQLEREQQTRAEAARGEAVRQQQITQQAAASADQARRQAVQAEGRAKDELWASYLAQAHAGRWSGQPGRRFSGLDALARAAAIRPHMDLRNEAIACMSLTDLRRTWQRRFEHDIFSHDFSPDLKRVALGDTHGNVWVHRVADGRLLSHYAGPTRLVGPVRFSPDGRFLTWAYRRPETADLVVCDLKRDRVVLRLPEGLGEEAVEFSPDSRRVAVGGPDGAIRLYDLPSGTEIRQLPSGPPPDYLQFDPKGRRLAVSSMEAHSIQIRDVATGAVTTTLVAPTEIFFVAWHPYRNLVAGAGADWHVYVWDVDKPEQPLARLDGHHGEVTRVAFTQGGTLLVSSGWDHTLRVWNLATQSQLVNLPGASFSPGRDDRHVGMLLGSGIMQIWELGAGRECRTFRHDGAGKGPWSGEISRDGRLLASTGDHGVAVWDLTNGRQIASLPISASRSAFFHPTAPYLITSGADGLYRWPIQYSAGGAVEIGPSDPIARAGGFERSAISRDGRTLAVTENHANHPVRVLHFGLPAWQTQITAPPATRLFLDVSPDGRWIVTGAWQGTGVIVWDARTGRQVRALPVDGYATVRFSPDGGWLATVTGAVSQVWKVGSWRPVLVVRRDDPDIAPGSAAFTPDGSVVALEQSHRVVRLIEVSTGRELARLEAADVPVCIPLCFSREGSLLATRGAPEVLQVWDLRAIRRGLKTMGLDWLDRQPAVLAERIR